MLHLVSGEDVIAEVIETDGKLICTNPLLISMISLSGAGSTQSLRFDPLIPLFTGGSVVMDETKVVFMSLPNTLIVQLYHDHVVDIIQHNTAAIVSYNKALSEHIEGNKKTLN